MVRLINCTPANMMRYIKENGRNVYVWGTGVIWHVCLKNIMIEGNVIDNVVSICDSDECKIGKHVNMLYRMMEIKNPRDMINEISSDRKAIIIITCSYFRSILSIIDSDPRLEGVECCILPVIFIENSVSEEINIESGMDETIPQKIHYCWFGENKLNDNHKYCINTWRKLCPQYEIVEWNEDSISEYSSPWVDEMRKTKKWALLSDYVRAYVLYNNGGFYFDTDVELVKNIEKLRNYKAFGAFEKWPVINTGGGCGSVKGFWYWKEVMRLRDEAVNKHDLVLPIAGGYYDTEPLIKKGMRLDGTFQIINDFAVMPSEYFHPFDYVSKKLRVTKNTYSIHRFNWSWASKDMREGELNDQDIYQEILSRCVKI